MRIPPVPSALLRALPSLAIGAAAALLLVIPSFRIPGHRGGRHVVEGFRPGLWDARFLVARGPAAVVLPPQATRVTLTLSGPADLLLRAAQTERHVGLDLTPSAIEVALPRGGRIDLLADSTIRLHELRLERTGRAPWQALLLVVTVSLAGAFWALRRGVAAAVASILLVAAAAALASRGGVAGLALAVMVDRMRPSLVLLLLVLPFLALLRLPKASASPAPATPLPAIFGALALASCLAQVLLLPQPLLIGDPAAYYDIGGRFLAALAPVRTPDGLADALQTLRPYGGLALTGLLYGLLRGVRDEPSTVYCIHSLAMAGAVALLVRIAVRLGGKRLGLLAGGLALLYPTFPVICGVVQPEPLILLLWTSSLDLLLPPRPTPDARRLALSGLAFGAGLALHPQGMWFLLLALLLVLLPFARTLARPPARTAAAHFALGLLPVALFTAAGEAYARPLARVLDERYGFFAYTASMPLGFWLFVDTDGWQGPVRIDDTRYAASLRAAEQAGMADGALARAAFTLRFVAGNPGVSLRTVLRNLHRLFHVPDNPPRRSWILPYVLQPPWHRALVVLFLLAVPLSLGRAAAPVLVPFALLAITYPLYHVYNKYAVPAAPFILLGAAIALARLASEKSVALLMPLAASAVGTLVSPASLALAGAPPHVARGLLAVLHLGGLAAAFFLVGTRWTGAANARVATGLAAGVLLLPSLAASWDDPSWRTFSLALDRPAEHEILLRPGEPSRLDAAREAYVVLDLEVPDGDPSGIVLDFGGGLAVSGRELQPSMPSFGLATTRVGRDPRTFRQWWRVPWRAGMAREERIGLSVRGSARQRLFGDLGTPVPDSVHHGLSLGQWPHLSVYRLMHDGEYRLAVRQPLSGRARTSRRDGRPLPGILGIRAVILDEDAGGAVWETTAAPSQEVVTGIWARAGRSARADLVAPAGEVRFDFGRPGPRSDTGGELRYVATGEYEGWYLMKLDAAPGSPVRLAVRPLHEMSSVPKYFLPELRPGPPPLPLDWAGVPYVGAARIIESREAPPWKPAEVF